MWSMILPLVTRKVKARSNHPRSRPSRRKPARLLLERLENRFTPSAIFVAEPNGSMTFLPSTDITAAFAGILRASGRSTVVTEQVRRGENDLTDHGAVIDAEFTPTGLVTLQPIPTGGFIEEPVTVQQLANYFRFDHFNWVQTVTLPNGWQSQLAPSGPQLHQPYTDPQSQVIRTTAANGAQADTTYVGDGSGYYWAENPYFGSNYWHNWLLNPSPLDLSPNSSPVSTPYWFTFEDAPFNPVAMQGTQPAYETFSTSLVGVDAEGNPVGPWSGYGTNFTWTSTTVGTNIGDFRYFRGSGIQPWINAFTNSDSPAQPDRKSV